MASGHTTSWQIEGEKVEVVTDFLFLGSKITVDGVCSHEIRRWLLLGRKALTNLDGVLKSRDITLPTKVHIVKAIVFSVVTYGCESHKEGHKEGRGPKNGCLWTVVVKKTLKSPWTERQSNHWILKEINPEYSLEGLMMKLQYLGHLMWTATSLEKSLMLGKIEGRRKRGWQRMTKLDCITNAMGMNFSKLQEMVRERKA